MRSWLTAGAACVLALVSSRNAIALTIDTQDRVAVAAAYREVYLGSEKAAHGWSGDHSACDAGTVSGAYLAAGLRRINWFRAMAGLPSIARLDPALNAKCQRGALLMTANRSLSHAPPRSWTCYSEVGAEAASQSNLGGGYPSLAAAISGWMRDENTPTGGHRRWILYPPLRSTGLGATFGNRFPAFVMWVTGAGGARPAAPVWVAWPPSGYVPSAVVNDLWSFSYPGADFTRARVTMSRGGTQLAVQLHRVRDGFGDNTLLWSVRGWEDEAPARDTEYTVSVSEVLVEGAPRRFRYSVTVIDLGGANESAARREVETSAITFELSHTSEVHVAVYDSRGRLVRTLVRGTRSAGKHEVSWDGLDANGRVVPAGRYTVRLRAGELEAKKEIQRG